MPHSRPLPWSPTGRRAAEELGHEPAIGAQKRAVEEREPVNPRWLAGTVLTGLGGCSLLAAALVLSIDSSRVAPEPPSFLRAKPRLEADRDGGARGDRAARRLEVIGARQAYRAPMTIKVGDREVIKDRNFVRVATAVNLVAGGAEVPPFNPLKLMTEGTNADQFAEPSLESTEADVSLVKTELATIGFGSGTDRALDMTLVASQIAEERRAIEEAGRRPHSPLTGLALLTRTLRAQQPVLPALAYAPAPEDTKFSNLEVEVVPENITQVAKLDEASQARLPVERGHLFKRGDTLEKLLRDNGAAPAEIKAIEAALTGARRALAIEEGRVVRVLAEPVAPGRVQILRVMVMNEETVEAIAARDDNQVFVSVAPLAPSTAPRRRPPTDEEGGGVRLYESFYQTALRQNIPKAMIEEMVRLFSNDFDFQGPARPDDSFEIFFAQDEADEYDLMSASMTVGGEQKRYYRFVSPDDGAADYYDEAGRSAKKFLIRKPLAGGELRSGFGGRFHPILRYYKMHSGVDWADKHGTPIVAAGNGRISKAKWDSGYGRRVEIEHANGYTTTYSHMSAFAKGIEEGARVRQGQVIGFMGATGLATGTHLHYEVMVNGSFQDPMRLKVPRGRQFEGKALADFRRHVEQVDALAARAPGNTPRVVARAAP